MYLRQYVQAVECFTRANAIQRHDITFMQLGKVRKELGSRSSKCFGIFGKFLKKVSISRSHLCHTFIITRLFTHFLTPVNISCEKYA